MPALVEHAAREEVWIHLEIQVRHSENHTPLSISGLIALRHRDKVHTHFIGGKSEVRVAHDCKAGSDQAKFEPRPVPLKSMAQGTSNPPD